MCARATASTMHGRRREAEAVDLDRQRKAAERVDDLGSVGDDDHPRGSPRRRSFRAASAAAGALDQRRGRGRSRRRHRSVRSSSGVSSSVVSGMPRLSRLRRRRPRRWGRRGSRIRPSRCSPSRSTKMPGGRSGPEPQPHSRLTSRQGRGGRLALEIVAHVRPLPCRRGARSAGSTLVNGRAHGSVMPYCRFAATRPRRVTAFT